MGLDSIVNVTIENTTASVSRQGFGVPLVLGYHTRFAERIRFYTTAAAMVTDGFLTTDPEYKAVSACFAQNPKPVKVAVGRRLTVPTWKVQLIPIVKNNYAYTVKFGTETATFTSDASATLAEIVTGLTAAINALSGAYTAVDTGPGTSIVVTADAAGTIFSMEVLGLEGDRALEVKETGVDAGIATDLADMLNVSKDWYGLILTFRGALEIAAAAAWIESNKRLFAASSQESEIKKSSTGDVASTLKTANYARSAVMHHPKPHEYPEAAWLGKMLPKDPGSATFAYKTLAGISEGGAGGAPALSYTDTELTNMEGKRANYYANIGGASITRKGVTSSGEWIDITLGLDWLRARIQERLYSRLVSLDKIPYTQAGLDLVAAEIEAQLTDAVNKGLLAPLSDSEGVTLPVLSSIAAADKVARLLPDVTFTATLAGAVHDLVVNGKVSV